MALNTYPYSPFPASTEQLHKGDNEDLQAQIDAIKDGTNIDSFGDVETALEDKTDTAVIAPEFDAEAGTYSAGDLVMYQGKLYEFTTAHETAGAWDATEVTEKTVEDEIDTVKSGLNDVNSNFANFKNTLNPVGNSIHQGDLNDIKNTCNIVTIGTNSPVSGIFNLHTMRTLADQNETVNAVTQIAVTVSGNYAGRVYIRSFWDNTWSSWREITTTALS